MGTLARRALSGVFGLAVAPLLAAPALANPPCPPDPAPVVGVGADTTEVLFDQLAADYRHGHGLASWRSTGSPTIVPKRGCDPIARPSGSSQGIDALLARQVRDDGVPCLDFARAIRPRLSSDPAELAFAPFALDGLTWAANDGGNAPASLTLAQLAGVYGCQIRTWDQVGGQGTSAIAPKLPIVGPGILSFLHNFGLAGPGPCVQTGVPQDEGTDPSIAGNSDALVMYDVSKYISQTVYHHEDVHGALRLGQLEGLSPTVADPVTGRPEFNAGQVDGVPGFPAGLRIQQSVAFLTTGGQVPRRLARLFAGPGSWICADATARADIAEYGFLPLPAATCGHLF
jgi:hypothetical protein